MRNNKGISLTEVCVTLCVAAIIGGIAIANFSSMGPTEIKRNLHQDGKLWARQVQNCLLSASSMGGWEIKRFKKTDESCPTNESDPCIKAWPCKALDNDDLKSKLGWECSGDSCSGVVDNDTNDTGNNRYCLEIRKEIKSKNHQVIASFNIKKQTAKIYCGTPTNYINLTNCKDPDDDPPPAYKKWNEGNTAEQCEWPIDSKTAPAST